MITKDLHLEAALKEEYALYERGGRELTFCKAAS